MWNEIRFGLAAALMLCALFVILSGMVGFFRFRNTLQRMHAAAVNDTLGLFLAIVSLILARGFSFAAVKYILVVLFLWTASPISTHLIAQLETRAHKNEKEKS